MSIEDEAADRAGRLTDALNRMASELAAVKVAGERDLAAASKASERRDRTTRRWVAAAMILAVAGAVVVYFLVSATLQADSARTQAVADRAQAAAAEREARNLCLSGNAYRAEAAEPWSYVISISPPARTAAQRQVLARFEAHLRVLATPRDCAHISPGQP